MADVFISYAQRVPEPTVAVADALTKRGFRPWYDVNLLPGQFFGTVIADNINRAQAVVTIWSAEALTSQWVPAESKMALDQKKLLCVRTPEVDPAHVPPPFNLMHVPLWTDLDGLFQALIGLGVRPTGLAGATSDLEALTIAAQRDWRAMPENDVEALEAFLEEYGQLAMFRRMAQKRLDALRALDAALSRAPAPVVLPEAPPARPEDVILRLDPGMHTAAINRISVSGDGRLMATASYDKTVKLWAIPEGRLLKTLRPPIGEGNEGKAYAVALDPAQRWLAASGWMKTGLSGHFIPIFDVESGRVIRRLGPLPNVVHDLTVSSDGSRLAAGLGGKNGIRVWDTKTWAIALEDKDFGEGVHGVAFASDGRMVASCTDGSVRLYAANGRKLTTKKAPGGDRPFGVAFANGKRAFFGAGGDVIALGYDDTTRIDLLDGESLELVAQTDAAGLTGGLASVGYLGQRLVGGSRGTSQGRLFVWADYGRGGRTTWPGPNDTVMDVAALPDGSLAYGAADPAFSLLSAAGKSVLFRGPAGADLRDKLGAHFTVSQDGLRLRFGLKPHSGAPVLFDLPGRRLTDAPQPVPDLLQADVKKLDIVDWNGVQDPKLDGHALPMRVNETAFSLAIAPDAKSFVLGTHFALRRFDADGKQIWERPVPGTAWGVNLARDGRLIFVAYGDGTIRWHRAEDGKELLALFIHLPQGPEGPREWILYTPEGFYDASSPNAEKLIGWHVNRGADESADFYPVETFAAAFKRPDKIDTALEGV
ncbi:MAG TPA: TIR domain-containing protein [Caulobacterales bacterium]|nr:TIR domain-containing protein [Caulobacterales bacterium]